MGRRLGGQKGLSTFSKTVKMTNESILSELNKLESMPHVDKKILKQFYARLKNPKILRSQNTPDHFCVFFVPFDRKLNQIYLGHHIKANDWIPPGGHIEENESPLDTVKREMSEELNYNLTSEPIEFFSITIKPIKNLKRTPCKKHWDLWYLVYMPKTNFTFDKGEFHTAKWVSLQEAKKLMKLKNYSLTLQKLSHSFFQKMFHQRLSNDE